MLIPSPIQRLPTQVERDFDVELWVKRDDLIHEIISGNKYRKLKYNLKDAIDNNTRQILTFGGAHSNHIIATAYLCNQAKLKCSAIIRGEEPECLSPTLAKCKELGMQLVFVSRTQYKQRNDTEYQNELTRQFEGAYIIPEGGANEPGVKGCTEIILECQKELDFDYITVDCGTGATLAGMIRSLLPNQKAIGVQVLKGGDFISEEVEKLNSNNRDNYEVWTDYHFGGYAKYQPELIEFMRWFYSVTGIKLDPVYTGKQFYAVFDQLKKGFFPKGSKIILTHTGGLQGIKGFEKRYGIEIYSD